MNRILQVFYVFFSAIIVSVAIQNCVVYLRINIYYYEDQPNVVYATGGAYTGIVAVTTFNDSN